MLCAFENQSLDAITNSDRKKNGAEKKIPHRSCFLNLRVR